MPFTGNASDVTRSTTRVSIERTPQIVVDVPQQKSAEYYNQIEDAIPNLVDQIHEFAEDELIIRFDDWTYPESIAETVMALAGEIIEFDSERYIARIRIDADRFREMRDLRPVNGLRDRRSQAEVLDEAIALANEGAHVTYVEPNYIAQALGVPNDPYYKYQWNFPLINVDTAWDTTTGEGVTIAIIDTGVAYKDYGLYRKAPDLANTRFVEGYNALKNNDQAYDNNGHGTHLAGIVAGSTNNGMGVAGIAYNASIMPIKVLDKNGNGTYADIAEGIYWAVDNGADIINLSLGGNAASSVLEDSIQYAFDNNVLIIAASGNSGVNSLMYPAAYNDRVLSVGAVRYDVSRANYSNYGTGLMLMAPGGDIDMDQNYDGNPDGILQQTLRRSGGYVYPNQFSYYFYRGTSVASPHVAGVAALVKSLGINDSSEIRLILTSTARDLGVQGYDISTGYGLVDASAAVEKAQKQLLTNNAHLVVEEESSTDIQDPDKTISNTEMEASIVEKPNDESQEKETVPVEEDATLQNFVLDLSTYNMFGKKDTIFAFWEKAYIGIILKDSKGNDVKDATLAIEVTNRSGKSVLRSMTTTNKEGELWAELGTFSRGSYEVAVTSIKDGFIEVMKKIRFRFR